MTVIQPAFNASNSIIVRLKIDLAVPTSSRLAFLCQTISGEGDIVGKPLTWWNLRMDFLHVISGSSRDCQHG